MCFKVLADDNCSLAPFGLLVEEAKVLSQHFDQLLYSHTKREGTAVAHSLAKYVIGILDFLAWIEDVSSQLYSVLQVDFVGLH